MNELDKELEKICRSEGHCCAGYGCEDWPMRGEGEIDNLKIEAISQIKTVILEALKAEWPEELELIDGREQFTSAFNGCRYDCLEVCNKLLGDSNAE